jgi:hypothetical protein
LLKRKCGLIISLDGEQDANMSGASLVKLERFARIDRVSCSIPGGPEMREAVNRYQNFLRELPGIT